MRMWNKISLSNRIYFLLCSLVLVTSAGGMILVWYTYHIDERLTSIIDKNLGAYHAAVGLEAALVNQKGFVSYYLLDSDPDWLEQLGTYRQIFKERLRTARALVEDGRQREAINRIAAEYTRYITIKDHVISYYEIGEQNAAAELQPLSRKMFFNILYLCENYKDSHMAKILDAKAKAHVQARTLRMVAFTAVIFDCLLGILLAVLLIKHILGPVRKLTKEAERQEGNYQKKDEIGALQQSVQGLIQNVDQTQSELQKSRESLLQAEKMALVGKLAAGMAHSIRNPFTSVKMRLFSLNRSLEFTDTQKEDFDVISEEIRHIDTIVQNFLEFSRPPKLNIQPISPSIVVDQAIVLLKHRLKSYDVEVTIERERNLPEIDADPEQLKEVLVNLVVNACEAMVKSGSIIIREQEARSSSQDKLAVIRVSDDGPGIPESIRDKVLQPFFTTKEEGTGLGLSIAVRIIEEHHGRMDIELNQGGGTTFIISLPFKGAADEHDSDY